MRTFRQSSGNFKMILLSSGMGVLEGKSSREIVTDMKTLFPTAYLVCLTQIQRQSDDLSFSFFH